MWQHLGIGAGLATVRDVTPDCFAVGGAMWQKFRKCGQTVIRLGRESPLFRGLPRRGTQRRHSIVFVAGHLANTRVQRIGRVAGLIVRGKGVLGLV